ncbi:ribosome recycling factor [Halobacillus kuroshimensis]|uniref:Ribosome-recycling factor n=2 Tax=Halobacillus TaxID=45667 RepID=A0A845DNZ1_9BACI|nr:MULTISPECIES: ribosome recycling factor [Halobacillus]MBN8234479.1 ribosome recycling factor [Halobacillus kuroshimensis]MCA1023093.1 ribosome recycling factor [Halobacillus litoralis]MYL19220.1 ribosome recycling factor [Halobacillus litoralis]MYL28366.1 ribosome recycling factor [Halobacillus halophilus]MYL37702.1 ribosome recycling factor [Halobacillus litoralis]
MSEAVINETKQQMEQAVQAYSRQLATVRAGRANPSILDNVYVDYYGAATPLNQLAQVSAPEPRLLVITPYDKTAIAEIEKAILKADLGLSPSSDGNVVRINIPALTEERRKDLAKVVGKYSEEAKVQVRNIRRDSNDRLKKLEKDGELTEDDLRSYQDDVQKLTDQNVEKIDQLAKTKEEEIMEV